MRILFYSLVCVLFFSCKSESEANLDFDRIDYYHLGISDLEETSIIFKELKTKKDSTFLSILFGEIPIKLNDSLIEQIESINHFNRFELPKTLNSKVSNCFSKYYEASFFSTSTTCIHFYRDILVFRKEKTIIGVALICFSCNSLIHYSKDRFQQVNSDFVELEKLLKNNIKAN